MEVAALRLCAVVLLVYNGLAYTLSYCSGS